MEPDTNSAPREKKIRWAIVIITLFVLGLAADHFFLHILFKEKQKEQHAEPAHQTVVMPTATLAQSIGEKTEPASTPVSADSLQLFQDSIKNCLGPELSHNINAENLIESYLAKNPVQTSQFQLENTHVRLADGSIRRLHLIQADSSNSKHAQELRYFQLDAEGLPVRIPLKPEQTINPRPEFLDTLKKQGSVIFHQVKENKILKDGTSISLNTVNDKIFEFQIFSKTKTLSCRELDCLCR